MLGGKGWVPYSTHPVMLKNYTCYFCINARIFFWQKVKLETKDMFMKCLRCMDLLWVISWRTWEQTCYFVIIIVIIIIILTYYYPSFTLVIRCVLYSVPWIQPEATYRFFCRILLAGNFFFIIRRLLVDSQKYNLT